MTMRVLKWTLEVTDRQEIDMPIGAAVLCVQMQHGKPQVWALCRDEAATASRVFYVRGTGHPIEGPVGVYVGTFQMHNGDLVFHVFDGGPAC